MTNEKDQSKDKEDELKAVQWGFLDPYDLDCYMEEIREAPNQNREDQENKPDTDEGS